MTQKSRVVRPWQPEWWIAGLGPDHRQECISHIMQGATPGPSYYLLLILSTLIAAYGLLSNSTATVIGAMIVAPLMGPIVGLAMGTVLGDARMFRHSLVAEISGALLVVLTGAGVALVAGVDHIDFSASEIANRVRPTLYDMAVGLAAGLAGSFCLIHPGLRASVAGVAIAVALVPPLTVTGITMAGWFSDQISWRAAFGSFMLFLANFLTIELAAGVLFYLAGFRVRPRGSRGAFRRAIVIQLLLLLSTAAFLSGQLSGLLRERIGRAMSRQALQSALRAIPGADLDDLDVEITGQTLLARAVVGSRTEIAPAQVAAMQSRIGQALQGRFPDLEVRLLVRTVSSTYATPEGFLFEPPGVPPSPEQVRSQLLEQALRAIVAQYPGVELSGFRPVSADEVIGATEEGREQSWPLEVTLRSPYEFRPSLVQELESSLQKALGTNDAFLGWPVRLKVCTVPISAANATEFLTVNAPGSEERVENKELNEILGRALAGLGQQVTLLNSRPLATNDPQRKRYQARVRVRGPELLAEAQVKRLRDEVVKLYAEQTGEGVELELELESELAHQFSVPPEAPTEVPEASPSPRAPSRDPEALRP